MVAQTPILPPIFQPQQSLKNYKFKIRQWGLKVVPNPNLQDLVNPWNRSLLTPFVDSLSSLLSSTSSASGTSLPPPIMFRILIAAFAACTFSLMMSYKWKWKWKPALFLGLLFLAIGTVVNIVFDILVFGSIK